MQPLTLAALIVAATFCGSQSRSPATDREGQNAASKKVVPAYVHEFFALPADKRGDEFNRLSAREATEVAIAAVLGEPQDKQWSRLLIMRYGVSLVDQLLSISEEAMDNSTSEAALEIIGDVLDAFPNYNLSQQQFRAASSVVGRLKGDLAKSYGAGVLRQLKARTRS